MKQVSQNFDRISPNSIFAIVLGCLMMVQNVAAKNEVRKQPNGKFTVAADKISVQALCTQFADILKVPAQIGISRGEKVSVNIANARAEKALRSVAKDVRIVYTVDPVAKTFRINRIGCFSKGHPSAARFGGNPNSVGIEVDPKALAKAAKGP